MTADRALQFLQECGLEPAADPVAQVRQLREACARLDSEDAKVLDAHVENEFLHKDIEAVMATMTEEPYLTHVPTLAGGTGREEVRRFYDRYFIPHWPADTRVQTLSRTATAGRVIDEIIMTFTHDREIPAILPGLAPTGKSVEFPLVVVGGLQDGLVSYEHIHWDQASVLVQLGVLDPKGLPVVGVEAARRLRDVHSVPANRLLGAGGTRPSA